ncbi:lipoprotein [Spiroplasma sp. AdecLV25b]|uniref:lipoprotein n=1 Tax=Spiroplasma sp. AdecLV25b TaxID=3027162 RepID=UPI0027E19EA2|nr:lipoprotein [Spiroplasma sp. AdecLV25b]
MRKLLSLLGVLTLGSITTTNVVACSNKPQVDPTNPADQSKLPFLYHEVKVTNLGDVKNDARDILTAFQNQNSNIKDDTLKVTDITNKTATINVDQYDTHFKKGTLHVTFNSIESKDLTKLITVKNVYANRNLEGLFPVPTKIKEQDVLDGVNALNGLNLTLQDVTVTLPNQDNNPATSATITAKGSQYQGTDIPVILNKNLDIAQIFTNTDIGDVYLPQELIGKIKEEGSAIAIKAFLTEFIGDANPLLQEFTDLVAGVQFVDGVITFDKNQLTIDANVNPTDNTLHKVFTNKVTFNFNINVDNRLSIDKAIKTIDLKKPASTNLVTIKQAIIDQNQDQLKSFSSEEVNNYLIVTLPDKTNSASVNVSWLPGSKNFLGHDPLAAAISGVTNMPPLNINVYFGIIKNDFVIQNAATGKTIFDNLHSYLKNTYQLSNDDSAAAIADFAVWYDGEEISNDDKTQISTEGNKPVTIKITLKTNVDDKYKTDLQKLIDNGFTVGKTYVSNTDVTDKK